MCCACQGGPEPEYYDDYVLCPDEPEENYCDGWGDCLYEPEWCSCAEAQALCEANGMLDLTPPEIVPYDGECDASGQVDSWGDGCEWYDAYPDGCGHYDTATFQADTMCCACQEGGADASANGGASGSASGEVSGAFLVGNYEKGYTSDDPDDYQAIEIAVVNGQLMWIDALESDEFSLSFDCSAGVLTTGDDCQYGAGLIVSVLDDGCLEFMSGSYCPVPVLSIDGGDNIYDLEDELSIEGLDMMPVVDVMDMTFE